MNQYSTNYMNAYQAQRAQNKNRYQNQFNGMPSDLPDSQTGILVNNTIPAFMSDYNAMLQPEMPQQIPQLPPEMPQQDAVVVEEPAQVGVPKEEAVAVVSDLTNQQRPTDNPSAAALHDQADAEIKRILSSSDPQSEWAAASQDPFWQQNDFYSGMIGVGLSLMSGSTPIEAFKAGTGMQQQQAAKDELKRNKGYLLDRYSADSVASAIASGDASMLKPKGQSVKEKMELELALDTRKRAQTLEDEARANSEYDRRQANQPGTWQQSSNGSMFNTKTGEVRQGVLGTPTGTATVPQGQVGSLTPYQGEDGNWYVPTLNKGRQTGEYQLANAAQTKTLSENESKKTPDANEVQANKDFARLRQLATENQVGTITGTVAQWDRGSDNTPGAVTRFRNVMGNDAENEAAQVAARIDGRMRSAGVADAKAMGASGINTAAEAEMYFQGMPRLNYSSKAALLRSLQEVEDYTASFNAKQGGKSRQGALSQQAGQYEGFSIQ